MSIEVIDNHSVEAGLIGPGKPVLDVGARGFRFAAECAKRGSLVIAMDPDPEVQADAQGGWVVDAH